MQEGAGRRRGQADLRLVPRRTGWSHVDQGAADCQRIPSSLLRRRLRACTARPAGLGRVHIGARRACAEAQFPGAAEGDGRQVVPGRDSSAPASTLTQPWQKH